MILIIKTKMYRKFLFSKFLFSNTLKKNKLFTISIIGQQNAGKSTLFIATTIGTFAAFACIIASLV